jgi:hypothetical protein
MGDVGAFSLSLAPLVLRAKDRAERIRWLFALARLSPV